MEGEEEIWAARRRRKFPPSERGRLQGGGIQFLPQTASEKRAARCGESQRMRTQGVAVELAREHRVSAGTLFQKIF